MVEMKAKALGLDTIFQGAGLIYVVLFLIVLAVVLAKSKTTRARWKHGALIAFGFGLLPYLLFIHETPKQRAARIAQETKQAEWRANYAKGKALFEEKCKTAGERIYKTVDNVEGVLLPTIRLERGSETHSVNNPLWREAAFANEVSGDGYIKAFLLDRDRRPMNERSDVWGGFFESVGVQGERGFAFVEQGGDPYGERFRATARIVEKGPNNRSAELIWRKPPGAAPRYAVTIENNIDPELRKYWVAGSTVRVVDTQTNTTLGELEVWRFDRSQGDTNQSMPWLTTAVTCPEPRRRESNHQTHYFVEKVLKSKQEN